jgi:hypothetical protein
MFRQEVNMTATKKMELEKSVGVKGRIYQMKQCKTCPLSQPGPVAASVWAAIGFMCDEERPDSTLEIELKRFGHVFPAPENVPDAALRDTLWRLIVNLAELHVFLFSTDHLSDRELYTKLMVEELPRETMMPCLYQNASLTIDLAGSCSGADVQHYLRYYADDLERLAWADDFPDMPMPPQEDPPYDRDQHLPQREDLKDRLSAAG